MAEKQKYLSILELELADLAEDVDLLIVEYKKRKASGEITNYVLLENLAVLQSEIHGIQSFINLLHSIDPNSHENLDAMVSEIKDQVKSIMDKSSFPEALYPIVLRRLDRVARYIKNDQE